VVDVVSVVWEAAVNPLTNNADLGGIGDGLAIFSDKPDPASSGDFSAVTVTATITPAISNVTVYFHAFDVDDPSSTNAPVDDETAVADNRGNSPDGEFDIALTTSTNGTCSTNFHVSMKPGDNYRVIASPIADFRSQYKAAQTNDHGALVTTNSAQEIEDRYTTLMLTVWRRLHVEVDSMEAVTNNRVVGDVTGIAGCTTGATNLTLSVNLRTGLNPQDNSTNLSTSTILGRFENGTIVLGTNNCQTSNGVTGNGDDFVVNASGFSLPAQIVHGGVTNGVGQVIALANGVFTIEVDLGTNQYAGATFQVVGVAFTITTNTTNTVTVGGAPAVPFILRDDDDETLLPYPNPPISFFQTILEPAYVKLINDGGGSLTNNKQTVQFVANVYNPDAAMNLPNAFESSGARGNDFWIVWVCSAFQPITTPGENYQTTDLGKRADGDSDSEVELVAIAPYGGALLFKETIRDGGAALYGLSVGDLEPPLVAHELGHSFGLPDRHLDADPVNRDSVMGYFWLSHGFAPIDIDIIRQSPENPGM
jgi:hypothetical protein